MKRTLLFTLAFAASTVSSAPSPKWNGSEFFANPLIDFHFTADPTAVEYKGRLFVYGTNDHQQYEEGTGGTTASKNTYEKIKSISIISTTDMANWTYHGEIDVGAIAPWIVASWAPSIVSREEADGKTHFYLYFSNSGWGTGVLTATSPLGPWSSPLDHSLVDGNTPGLGDCKVPFDPGAAVAPDGSAYIAFGGTHSRIARLGADMISFDGNFAEPPHPFLFEANELNFIGGKCVYTYNIDWSAHEPWEEESPKPSACSMVYLTSPTPLDAKSWSYRGEYAANPIAFGQHGANNHTHLHKFKGKWYLFYHNHELEFDLIGRDGGFRNIAVDLCEVDEQTATVKPVEYTRKGVEQIAWLNPYQQILAATAAATSGTAFTPSGRAGVMIAHPETPGAFIALKGIDFGKKPPTHFVASVRGTGRVEFRLDAPKGPAVATITAKKAGADGSFATLTATAKTKVAGVHNLFIVPEGENLELASWRAKR